MKNIILVVFILAILALTSTQFSCSKDKITIKELDGDWKVTSIVYNDTALEASYYENINEKCKQAKEGEISEEDCPATMTMKINQANGDVVDITQEFRYRIEDKGTQLRYLIIKTSTSINGGDAQVVLCSEDSTINCSGDYTIVEHSDSKFIMEQVDSDGKITVTTMEKI